MEIINNRDKHKEGSSIQKQILTIDKKKHAQIVFDIARRFCPTFRITDELKTVMGIMFSYFTNDQNFESEYKRLYKREGSLKKGLFLMGGVGTGKTLLFKIFREYAMTVFKQNGFREYRSHEIVKDVNENGMTAINKYVICPNFDVPVPCYVDDIGSSVDEVNNYGTKISVMEQLFTDRYVHYQRGGPVTHASSNLFPKQLKEVYDERIIDRFKEMFNFIEVNGKSFRS